MLKNNPIIISELSDDKLINLHATLYVSIHDDTCEECTPPPELFEMFTTVEDEMESRHLI